MKKIKTSEKKKLLLVILFILILVIVACLIYYYRTKHSSTSNPGNQGINYSPPTDQEKKETEEFKNKQLNDYNANKSNSTSNNQNNKRTVTPIIVDVAQHGELINTNAFIQGVVEDGGQCNFVFTQNAKTVTQSSSGFVNATTTTCTPISFNKSELSIGTWSVKLNYSSTTSEGSSQFSTLEVK